MSRLIVLILCLVASSCLTLKVKTEEKPGFDFSKLERYCWLQGCEFSYKGPASLQEAFAVEAFENAIVEQLREKGYVLDEGNPDFLINVTILLEEKSHQMIYVEDFETLAAPVTYEEEVRYLKGTLLFDAIDMEQTEVFWRSTASKFMDVRPEIRDVHIQKSVEKVLKKFPAKSEK